ncbi:autophagy-related protein 13 [Blumeria hordei DH14]|uniref:Autophagy-related protein 13 n=1 Tax=Blumeria graminis f. sp. hordei (strain DH14) TaxID=546991 RepID=N1JPT7_BLUG1|nr:autophagy-related protein 13 [Blumeria hordei DH14]
MADKPNIWQMKTVTQLEEEVQTCLVIKHTMKEMNFHLKAAILVLQSRILLPVVITQEGSKKVNKWFQIETDDTNSFRQELNVWRQCDGYSNRPPPLIIETYLDTMDLAGSQNLVIVDDSGKRWDVNEALNSTNGVSLRSTKIKTQVILERWRFELKDPPDQSPYDFGPILPTMYKKFIVFFRSLYATTKFVPAGRYVRILGNNRSAGSVLKAKCRIVNGTINHVTTNYVLGTTETPVGQIYAEVTYRNDCNFKVDDSRSLLGSRFIGADDYFFQPSLGTQIPNAYIANQKAIVGSLPVNQQQTYDQEPIQTYGSLSTFHGDAPPKCSSPISALRAVKNFDSDLSSPPAESLPKLKALQTSRNSIKSIDGTTMGRRPSVSFQPFKAGSLSSSPGQTKYIQRVETTQPQSSESSLRTSGVNAIIHTRNRSSLAAGTPATLRSSPIPHENIVPSSVSSSPKPVSTSKYSSSFNRRRGQTQYSTASKILVNDDQSSSGRQSFSSSAQRGSLLLAEASLGLSPESLQTDDDNISEFLKVLDRQKTLKSLETSADTTAKRTSALLSRYQSLRESHNALTESMGSSALLHRSSSSSSRQLSSLPPMMATTSISSSSSPGKPVSPHTPHTPAIPSRLSSNSIAEHSEPRRPDSRSRSTLDVPPDAVVDDPLDLVITSAIDIPHFPRIHYRRSNSATQNRPMAIDNISDLTFGAHRSISLGAKHKESPSPCELISLGRAIETAASFPIPMYHTDAHPSGPINSKLCLPSSEVKETAISDEFKIQSHSSPNHQRSDFTRQSPVNTASLLTYGTSNSLHSRPSVYDVNRRLSNRYIMAGNTNTAYEPDDEPLLFQMSEIGRENPRTSPVGQADPKGEPDTYCYSHGTNCAEESCRRW